MNTLKLYIGFQIPQYFVGDLKFGDLLREYSKTLFLHVDVSGNCYLLERAISIEKTDTLSVFSNELKTYESSFKNYHHKFLFQIQKEFEFNCNIKGYILKD